MHNGTAPGRFGRKGTMTNAMAALGIAIGGSSLICYALMTRSQSRQRKRGPSGDNATDGGTSNFSGGDGWSLPAWFGGDHAASDSSGNPVDSGGDSGGGGDGGGSGD
jgi:hypothetical protein